MAGSQLKQFDYNKVVIGEELGSVEYVLSQEILDKFRQSVEDPVAPFPTIAVKHDGTVLNMVYEDNTGGVNAGNEVEFHTPPHPRHEDQDHRPNPRQVHTVGQALPGHRGHRR